ncbi:hypothetical protein FEMY_22270 [Ferrovum myxofaciens]|uniref:Uncharacterized protein n=1 Tax=Ferrovum myxofaciens TaxID=416213 RepID=A0A149VVI9_9PROT|nr:hypothetical protein FEMY_22270 [Ferrovum myxofaciens]
MKKYESIAKPQKNVLVSRVINTRHRDYRYHEITF